MAETINKLVIKYRTSNGRWTLHALGNQTDDCGQESDCDSNLHDSNLEPEIISSNNVGENVREA